MNQRREKILNLEEVLFAIFATLMYSSCHDNGTGPPPISIHPDYTWTADTLAYPGSFQTNMQAMFASSSKDIYIVGHNDQNRGNMYHYDGNSWTPAGLMSFRDRTPGLTDIHGTSATDIWAVGSMSYGIYDSTRNNYIIWDSSFTMHYDGHGWEEYAAVSYGSLEAVWCISSSDVWAAGSNSLLFHFDGTKWTKYNIQGEYFFSSMAATSHSDVYLVGNRDDYALPIDSAGYFLFRFNGSSWSKADSVMEIPGSPVPHFGRGLWTDGKTLYSLGPGIFRRDAGEWTQIYTGDAGHMFQSGSNNIIAVGQSVYQFNGVAWKEYKEFNTAPRLIWFDCYTDGQEVFIIGDDFSHYPQTTIVLHGR